MTKPTLLQSAQNAITNCIELAKSDRLIIVTDKESFEIGNALKTEAERITPSTLLLKIEDYGTRPMKALPDNMVKDIKVFNPNVSIYAAQGKTGELQNFRSKLIDLLAYQLNCSHAHMIGITKQIMLEGMATDYNTLYDITQKIYKIAKTAKTIKVTNPKGTDVTATFDPKLKWVSSHGKIKKGAGKAWQNLPGTETFTCPKSVDGWVVAEILGDYFSEKYGHLKDPVIIDIKDGFIWNIECKNKELEEEVKKYLFTSPLGNRVGEFAIGTNVGLTHFIGNLLQDEKFPGMHMAFGHPYPKETGADWDSPTHLDVIPTDVDIFVDDKQIMKGGKFIL